MLGMIVGLGLIIELTVELMLGSWSGWMWGWPLWFILRISRVWIVRIVWVLLLMILRISKVRILRISRVWMRPIFKIYRVKCDFNWGLQQQFPMYLFYVGLQYDGCNIFKQGIKSMCFLKIHILYLCIVL